MFLPINPTVKKLFIVDVASGSLLCLIHEVNETSVPWTRGKCRGGFGCPTWPTLLICPPIGWMNHVTLISAILTKKWSRQQLRSPAKGLTFSELHSQNPPNSKGLSGVKASEPWPGSRDWLALHQAGPSRSIAQIMWLPKICQVDFIQCECFDPRMNVKQLVIFKTCSVRVTLSEG